MAKSKKLAGDVAVVSKLEAVPKEKEVHIVAKFKRVDPTDGTKEILTFEGKGSSVKEALDALVFPKGVNALVNVTVAVDGIELMRALAPHRARAILEYKKADLLKASFRGIL